MAGSLTSKYRYLGAVDPENPILRLLDEAAERHGVDRNLVHTVAQMESKYQPGVQSTIKGQPGAIGVMQLMPATARTLGVKNIWDPEQNIDGGVRYLKEQLGRFGGDRKLALAAYNAGPGAVRKYGGVPPYAETRNYVAKGDRLMAQAAPPPAQQPAPQPVPESAPQPEDLIQKYKHLGAMAPETETTPTDTPKPEPPRVVKIRDVPPRAATPLELTEAAVKGFVINPIKGVWEMGKRIVQGPEETGRLAKDIWESQWATGQRAAEAWKAGDRSSAVGYGIAALIPLLGPAAAQLGDRIGESLAKAQMDPSAENQKRAVEDLAEAANLILQAKMSRAAAPGIEAARGGTIGAIKAVPRAVGGAMKGAAGGAIVDLVTGGTGGFTAGGAAAGAAGKVLKGFKEGAQEALAARKARLAAKRAAKQQPPPAQQQTQQQAPSPSGGPPPAQPQQPTQPAAGMTPPAGAGPSPTPPSAPPTTPSPGPTGAAAPIVTLDELAVSQTGKRFANLTPDQQQAVQNLHNRITNPPPSPPPPAAPSGTAPVTPRPPMWPEPGPPVRRPLFPTFEMPKPGEPLLAPQPAVPPEIAATAQEVRALEQARTATPPVDVATAGAEAFMSDVPAAARTPESYRIARELQRSLEGNLTPEQIARAAKADELVNFIIKKKIPTKMINRMTEKEWNLISGPDYANLKSLPSAETIALVKEKLAEARKTVPAEISRKPVQKAKSTAEAAQRKRRGERSPVER